MSVATSSAVSWAPLLPMLLVGAMLALLPLGAWFWRHRHDPPARRGQALCLLTAFLTFDLILFGAFTRLADAGLGCPDWPGCYGQASPLGAMAHIQAAQEAMPTGPVTHGKAWVEMVHRYLATGVGALILTLVGLCWRWRTRASDAWRPPLGWALTCAVWVCMQGAFGALTVTMKLYPAIVTLHLLAGVGLLVLLLMQAHAWQVTPERSTMAREAPLPGLTRAWPWVAGVVLVQMALGAWVSTNYAVLMCSTFPTCQGQWWPAGMDFAQGFTLLRPLGLDGEGQHLSAGALTAIHMAHRIGALVSSLAVMALVWGLWRAGRRGHVPSAIWSRRLLLLLLLQWGTGLSNVLLSWPLLAAVLHTGGAALMMSALTWVGLVVHARSRPVGAGSSQVWVQTYVQQ